MDGYHGSNDIVEKLEFACYDTFADLYWGEAMRLLEESLQEIKKLRQQLADNSRD